MKSTLPSPACGNPVSAAESGHFSEGRALTECGFQGACFVLGLQHITLALESLLQKNNDSVPAEGVPDSVDHMGKEILFRLQSSSLFHAEIFFNAEIKPDKAGLPISPQGRMFLSPFLLPSAKGVT